MSRISLYVIMVLCLSLTTCSVQEVKKAAETIMPQLVVSQAETQASLTSNRLEVIFKKHPDGGIYIERLALPGQSGLLRPPDPDWKQSSISPLWLIDFADSKKKYTSHDAEFIEWRTEVNERGYLVLLTWNFNRDNRDLNIVAQVEVDDIDATTRWQLSVKSNTTANFTLRQVVFPIVGDIVPSGKQSGDIRFTAPAHWGEEYYQADNCTYRGYYPSSRCVMQFWAYYNINSQDALYIGALDAQGYHKNFSNKESKKFTPYVRAELSALPEAVPTLFWELPYVVEVRPYSGTWYEASKFYREWLIRDADWMIPNSRRKDLWLRENVVWMRGKFPSETTHTFRNPNNLDDYVRLRKAVGVPSALHLYNWHKHPFDNLYPDYFPAREGLTGFLEKMKNENIRVIPYINGRIADWELTKQEPEYKENASVWKYGNKPEYKFETYQKHNFLVMCPNTKFWQNKMFEIVDRLQSNFDFSGIYFDQVCNSPAWKCTSPKHGHAADPVDDLRYSSGQRWYKGYRELFQPINKRFDTGSDFITASEDNAELWNDQIDLYLMYNPDISNDKVEFSQVSMFPAVYGGYATTMGFTHYNSPQDKYINVLAYKLARCYVWGSQLGWIYPTELWKQPQLVEYLSSMAKVRYKIRDYINYGEMMAEPAITGAVSKMSIDEVVKVPGNKWFPITFEELPILSSFWRTDEGKAVVLLTNYSAKDFTRAALSARIDLEKNELSAGRFEVRTISPTGESQQEQEIQAGDNKLEFSLAPYSTIAIELVRK